MKHTLHIFSGKFESQSAACEYTEEQWENPVPDDSWSDEDYEAWEERNPTWRFREDLELRYMSSEFIETISGKDRLNYLMSQLSEQTDFAEVSTKIPKEHNTLVLVMSKAFDGYEVEVKSTDVLAYHGEYRWKR